MESLPEPNDLMIEIDEWQAAQENIEAVSVCVTWRCVDDDPVLAALIAGLPPENYFIPIRLADGRTELAVDHPDARLSWKHLRFGKGPPIFELAKHNYEAWAGEGLGSRLARDRKQLTDMIRRHVPKFDDYTDKEQVDFIIRTQKKVNAVRSSVKGFVNHLEYASPDRYKAVPPLKDETEKVRAAVFSELMDSRRAGELLAVRHNDKTRYENQRVRKMAKLGRRLLCGYYGAAEYGAKINRMQRFYKWWEWFNSIEEDPKEQIYVLLAEAHGTSAELEKHRAEEDGFVEKLDEWIAVVEPRLKAQEMAWEHRYDAQGDEAERTSRRLWAEQTRIQETDQRFAAALSMLGAP